jgi:inhibitor of KinA
MEDGYTIFPLGERAVTFSFGNTIVQHHHHRLLAMQKWLTMNPVIGTLDIVIAYSSLTVVFDLFLLKKKSNGITAFEFVREILMQAYHQTKNTVQAIPSSLKRIPVCYEQPFAPDIAYLSSVKSIPVKKIVELHAARIYQVYMIGFLPGFPYMAEVDEKIVVPRKQKPQSIAPGSVGIAGIQTGIYPVHSPGGWQIIGRTPYTLFDKDKDPPVMLEAGDRVQFYAITLTEFKAIINNPT